MRARAVVALLVIVALVAAGCGGKAAGGDGNDAGKYRYESATSLGETYPVSQRMPAGGFTADLLGGGTTSLAEQAGKIVVLNFWATWCAPCVIEMPQFDAVYRKYQTAGEDVAFLGIDTKDRRDAAESFVEDNDISYPIAFDPRGETAVRLGKIPSLALPFTVLIDRQGRVAAVYLQQMSGKDLEIVLDKLLAES